MPALTGVAFNECACLTSTRRLQTLALLGIVLVRGGMDIINAFSIETLAQRTERDARQELYLSLLGKSQTFHNRQRVGDIMARASNDHVRQLNLMLNPGVALLTDSMMSILMLLLFISFINVQLLSRRWSSPSSSPFCCATTRGGSTRSPPRFAWRFGDLNAGLNETIAGIEVVKSAAQEAQEKASSPA